MTEEVIESKNSGSRLGLCGILLQLLFLLCRVSWTGHSQRLNSHTTRRPPPFNCLSARAIFLCCTDPTKSQSVPWLQKITLDFSTLAIVSIEAFGCQTASARLFLHGTHAILLMPTSRNRRDDMQPMSLCFFISSFLIILILNRPFGYSPYVIVYLDRLPWLPAIATRNLAE